MRLRGLTVVAASLLMGLSAALAGEVAVVVAPKLSAETAAPGDPIEVIFHVQVPNGWHLYPPGASEGVPVSAELENAAGVAPGALEARSGKHEIEVEGIGKVSVLEGTFDLALPLKLDKDAALGPRKLEGKLHYQVCNDKTCEMPKTIAFSLALDIEPPAVGVGPPVELPKSSGPVIANFSLAPAQATPGGKATVELELFVAPGYHVYAPGSEGGRETKLDLELPPGFTATPLEGPPPTKTEKDDIGQALEWEGKVKLARTVAIPANAPASVTIKARASWQVCNEKGCRLGHEDKTLTLAVAGGTGPTVTDGGPGLTGKPPVDTTATPPPAAEGPGLGALVLTSITLGLINILMPCTLPMIPITISIFSKGKKLSRSQSVFRASVYVAGIVVSFVLMGAIVQVVFKSEGQGFLRTIATNGPLNVVMGAAFVYFALSFFGYYEIELPEFLRAFVERSVDKAKASAPGEGGIPLPALFLMGFFFVLTSYTCGAPLVLSLFTVSLATNAKASVIIATTAFAATTAAPFFFLALVPGFLKSLPKSGAWFKTFKVTLGTIELAAALKFFQNADAYFATGYLSREVFLGLWAIAAGFLALYVPHVIMLSHEDPPEADAPKPSRIVRLGVAFPFLALTAYLLSGLAPNKKLNAYLESFVDPSVGSIKVYPSYDKAADAAKKSGKPLFLEFSGHT